MKRADAAFACRICSAPVTRTFCDLGSSPLANAYLEPTREAIRAERRYPLHAWVCDACLLVQIEAFERPDAIFGNYAYFSSYSSSWLEHSRRYVDVMIERLGLSSSSLVAEVASNDGYLLQYFVERGVPVVGVEPAANVAEAAIAKGIRTEILFFGTDAARSLARKYGRADLIVGNNVIAHVPDLHDFIGGVRLWLGDRGTATFEFPHLMRLIEFGQFDTIYHEHFSYFSLHSIERALRAHALAVVDVEELPTHGGSLRIFVRHEAAATTTGLNVAELREREVRYGLLEASTYDGFQQIANARRHELLAFVSDAKRAGKGIVGYGAPAKGNTLLNFCGIGVDEIPYTVDKNPHKQGKLLPGSHIPIDQPQRIFVEQPDIVLVLPWNLRDEIFEELAAVRSWGGRFAVAIPKVEVL